MTEIRRSIQGLDLGSLFLLQLRQLAWANGISAVGHSGHKKSWIVAILAHARSTDGTLKVPSFLSGLFPSASRKRKRTEMESSGSSGAAQVVVRSTNDERAPKRRLITPTTSGTPLSGRISRSNWGMRPSSSSASHAQPATVPVTSSFSISTFATFILRILLSGTEPVQSSGVPVDLDQLEYVFADSAEGKQLDEYVGGLLTSRVETDELKIEKLWDGIRERLAASRMDRLVQKWNLFRLMIEKFVISGQVSFEDAKVAFSGGFDRLVFMMSGLMQKHVEKRAREGAVEFLLENRVSEFRKKKKAKAGESGRDEEDADDDEAGEEIAVPDVPETLAIRGSPFQSMVRKAYGPESGRIQFFLQEGENAPISVRAFTWTPFSVLLKRVGPDSRNVRLSFRDRSVRAGETPEEIGLTESSRLTLERRIFLKVRSSDGEDLCFKMFRSTKFKILFQSYCEKMGKHLGSVVFLFDLDTRIAESDTPARLGMEDWDIIDANDHQVGGKPVVLLYPPSHAESLSISSVRVRLNSEKWKVLAYYPQTEPLVDPYTVQWRSLVVDSNGNITTHSNPSPSTHQYLFWESLVLSSSSPFDFEASQPVYVVPSDRICPFLLRLLLNQMCMKQKDAHNMITYWLKDLMKSPFTLLQLMSSELYESLVELIVDPRPEVFIRVFLLFCGCSDISTVVREPNVITDLSEFLSLPSVENLGDLTSKFVCYEWGGMNLRASRLVRKPQVRAGSIVL